MNKFAVIDLETTGNAPNKGDRIIEIGIVIYQDGEIIDQYNQLINPNKHISRFISHLTGITNEMVIDKPSFEEVADDIIAFFKNVYFVAHNVPFDLGFLNVELKNAGYSPLKQPIIDTVELSRVFFPKAKSFKLAHLSRWLKLEHNSPHRALSDAYVTAKLLDQLFVKLDSLPLTTIKQLLKLEPYLKSNLSNILIEKEEKAKCKELINQSYDYPFGLAVKPMIPIHQQANESELTFGELLNLLFDNHTPFEKWFERYEDRPGQQEMAEYIYHAFQSHQHGIIEAGAGIGKSIAYLIAALYQAKYHHEKIIVSTHLTQLQKQLLHEEIPRLRHVLPFPFQATLLKGKQHYLSLPLFKKALQEHPYRNYDELLIKAMIIVWLTETETGDIDELQLPSGGDHFFKQVSVATEHALQVKVKKHGESFYEFALQQSEQADLIIINHALLADYIIQTRSPIYGINKIIVDEAHHLERVFANKAGMQIDYLSFQKRLISLNHMLKGLHNHHLNHKSNQLIATLLEENDMFFRYIYHYVNDRRNRDINKNDVGRYQCTIDDPYQSDWQTTVEMANRLILFINDLSNQLSQIETIKQEELLIGHHTNELREMKDKLKRFFTPDEKNAEVRWIEIESYGAKNAVYLYQEPLQIQQLLRSTLFKETNSVILTSASITIDDQFEFFKKQIGLDSEAIVERKIPSPYVYQNQVKVLIPNDFPLAHYKEMDPFIEASCEAIFTLAEITKGRMLILFNSYEMLKKAYYLLKELFNDDYVLIAQGISSGSHERLKKNFQSFNQAILFGTNAFWEGLDIPGSDLTCVVMVRLPFDNPNHPVFKAKYTNLQSSGQNPFLSLSLPNAVIRFKQGFGRLIRSHTDRGIIFICDDRIMTKHYGQTFLNSIANVPTFHRRTNELLEIANNWI
ncbi:ATP-dependent DNA helicase DinG [Amphibacillus cookii]|uniref:ATP-dependent DNA helicase DinG n=1 Tax=Amphibacillus cookii TaxID=767787 RepID=UPI00195C9405|nr:ATP-dependent DNA helicase DinG [Amphibacillus cookii]MBM7542535.1 ATP-dependent DNA helicase DinG [Amphibacillus cookii]